MGIGCIFLFKTAMYSFSVCLKPSVEDFRSEINSSVSESVILERSKSSKQQAYY
jgi:hypothetical protein